MIIVKTLQFAGVLILIAGFGWFLFKVLSPKPKKTTNESDPS